METKKDVLTKGTQAIEGVDNKSAPDKEEPKAKQPKGWTPPPSASGEHRTTDGVSKLPNNPTSSGKPRKSWVSPVDRIDLYKKNKMTYKVTVANTPGSERYVMPTKDVKLHSLSLKAFEWTKVTLRQQGALASVASRLGFRFIDAPAGWSPGKKKG